jgi:predicted O-methyltransferase YrrM
MSYLKRLLKVCPPEREVNLVRKFTALLRSPAETLLQARIRRRVEAQSKCKISHAYSYEDSLSFLDSLGTDPSQSRGGSMPRDSLQFMQSHFDRLDATRPIIALHVGNFLGVSLAYLAYALSRLHPNSRVISIDPNLTHHGIARNMDTASLS